MNKNRFRWVLGLGLGVLALLGAGLWRLGTLWSSQEVERRLRAQLTAHSALVLGPLEVHISPWRDFPHLTASVRNLALTDTAYGRAVPVLRIGRADMRLTLADLWHRRIGVSRVEIADVVLVEEVDSLGRAWGLRGRGHRRSGPGVAPAGTLNFDSVIVRNAAIRTANAFTRNGLTGRVALGRFGGSLRGGILHLRGTLVGELAELRNRNGALISHEAIRASVGYRYDFVARRGRFRPGTYALLRGDTVAITGTHTVPPGGAAGTLLALRFAGQQPLVAVLQSALPPSLRPYLAGASSPSKARIEYTLRGLSGPTQRPRTHLVFSLQGASLRWPDSLRRISRWDLAGTLDNGPAHRPATTRLDLTRCRLYSPAGQLDVVLGLRDFRRPVLAGRVRGQTTLPELAAVLALRGWRARRGRARVDLTFRGVAATRPGSGLAPAAAGPLALRGTVALADATLGLPHRRAEFTHLSGQITLRDSLWTLRQVRGELAGMPFRGQATTRNLYRYLAGQTAQADIRGEVSAATLRPLLLPGLFRLLPDPGARAKAPSSPAAARAAARRPPAPLLPPGLHLALALRCDRMLLPTDTLRQVALTVQHDGRRLDLRNARAQVWGGTVLGQLSLPSTGRPGPGAGLRYDVALRFGTLAYNALAARLLDLSAAPDTVADAAEAGPLPSDLPPSGPRAGGGRRAGQLVRTPSVAPATAATAALGLRQLLQASAGRVRAEVGTLLLPTGEHLRTVSLRLDKAGPVLRLPYLTFVAPQGGRGRIRAEGRLNGLRLAQTTADIDLRYHALDVPQLLQLLASLAPRAAPALAAAARGARPAPGRLPGRAAPTGNRTTDRANRVTGRINRAVARAQGRAKRSAGQVRRLSAQTARASRRAARPEPLMAELFETGALTATLRIAADEVAYAAVRGTDFRLLARLLPSQARLDVCTLNTLQGRAELKGQLRTDGPVGHHPLRAQILLDGVALPAVFSTLTALHLNVLGEANVRGSLRCAGSIRADLGPDFLPRLAETSSYLHADFRRLELLDLDLVTQALHFLRAKRTTHLYFEPVSADFVLDRGQLLIPRLRLNSNLTNLELSGLYSLDGRADLYLGLNPLQVLFGSNRRRVASIEADKTLVRNTRRLTYLHLTRPEPVAKYEVRLFKEKEQRRQQFNLRQQAHRILIEQQLDTTMR